MNNTNYDELSINELVSIWKGFSEGSPKAAAATLESKIRSTGKSNLKGPGKVVYLYKNGIRFTVLTQFETCRHKGILYQSQEEYNG